ncbi:MAG TPA: beta-galactosidase, partial [Verrucomicrobiae bacterium]|nr:beta-galactosidase [Verrucomicrobiae bacterium]
ESYWEEDARRMQECGVNTVRMGEFGWALMEPREGHYDFSLFDRAIETLGRHGIKTIFGTPTAAPPKWLTHKYPEVLDVRETGQPVNDQSRRQICYNSPVYRRFSREIVEALARHYRDNTNIIGWQVDNEMNNENPECYSDSCRAAFRTWLRKKYGTLDELNARWGTVVWSQIYSDWGQIDLPFPTPAFHNPALMLDFKRFISDSAADYLNDQVEILRRGRPDDFLTHNGVFKNINYYTFSRNLDLYAYDNYPTFKDSPRYPTGAMLTLVRGLNGRFMIMEQLTGPAGQTYLLRTPRPGEARLWAMQAVAQGADGLLHFRWRSAERGAEEYWYGVLDHDNAPRARFAEFKQEGQELQKIGPQIVGSKVVSQMAVIKDFEDEWVFDYQFLTTEVNVGAAYDALFRAASEQRYNIDFVGPTADLSGYKLVFAPQLALMDDPLAGRLRQFVKQGGTLVMSAQSAIKDRDNAFTADTIPIGLTNVFGVELDSFQTYQPPSGTNNILRFDDGCSVPVQVFAEVLHPTTAHVVGRWERDYLKDSPAATEQPFGKGKAVYYGSLFNLDAARCLIKRYAGETGLKPLLVDVPEQVEVTCRTKDGTDFYFLLNHGNSPVTVNVGAGFVDVLAGEAAAANLALAPFDYRVLKRERMTGR